MVGSSDTNLSDAGSSEPLLDAVSPASDDSAEAGPRELRLEFKGDTTEYFRIWIVNMCLTLLTLGVFSAWAKVRRQRYFYACTFLDGSPFEYLGRPIPILKGRLIAAVLLAAWFLFKQFSPTKAPLVVLAAALLAPWVVVKSMAFRAHATAYRNMRFSFRGSVGEAVKLIYGLLIATLVTLGLAASLLEQRVRRYLMIHTRFGGFEGRFTATGQQFFGIYFKMVLLVIVAAIPLGMVLAVTTSNNIGAASAVGVAISYALVLLSMAYKQARVFNLCWRNTCFGGLYFDSELKFTGLLGLYLTNGIAVAASLGLLIPWAVIRTIRYRVERMRVYLEGNMAQFVASESPAIHAVGAEVADAFDLDLAF